jgi:hypothetical protein
MNKSPPPANSFGLGVPSSNFEALIDGTRSPPLVLEIPLDTGISFAARTAIQVKLTGNMFYVDQAPDVGHAYVIFEGVQDETGPLVRPAIYVQPGYLAKVPFANLRLAWPAQPGKVLRIIYGTDIDMLPSLNGQVAISGAVNAVNYGMPYQGAYRSVTPMALNTPDTIFSPGANGSGAVIWAASFSSYAAASDPIPTFLAKTSAPASNIDGDVLLLPGTIFSGGAGGPFAYTALLANPIFVPAGKGLYYIVSNGAETLTIRSVLYTLL